MSGHFPGRLGVRLAAQTVVRHLTREAVGALRLLRSVRTIAVVGPSRRAGQRSRQVFDYLRRAGYDVVPVRGDRAEIGGVRSAASVLEIPGQIDLVLVFGPRSEMAEHVAAAARKRAEAVWVMAGTPSDAVRAQARRRGMPLIDGRDIVEDERSLRSVFEPPKLGVHRRRRKEFYEDDRKTQPVGGYQEAGGGGRLGGGGGRAILDEKKMTAGRPSRRRGTLKPRRSTV